ncbi:MAG TPA: DeoR/GlpR family DNA-binding transcription regulator, partial [Planctomicrobium sp.]|nr:DeoR/GlpR family DNA-binding transcription regulator [Planctomicrobium sp.]
GRQLAARKDLRILTHSVRLLIEMGESAASLTCIGGDYRPVSQALVGGLAFSWLNHLRCDMAIIGASGLDDTGASTTELSEAGLKQLIIERSQQAIIVADHRKWEKPAAVQFAPWNQVHSLITDETPSHSFRKAVDAQETRIVVARQQA